MTADSRIIAFYRAEAPDHRGRYLREIHSWPDDQLEAVHDYVQWLFPLSEPSAFNVSAPVLSPANIDHFRSDPQLQRNLRASFFRMLEFFGFEMSLSGPNRSETAS
jgi:Opioid growth factor receptor (OGFr) conserved region